MDLPADVRNVLVSAVLASVPLYMIYWQVVFISRKLGMTRKLTMIDHVPRWIFTKFGWPIPDDFGDYRSEKFRQEHQQK